MRHWMLSSKGNFAVFWLNPESMVERSRKREYYLTAVLDKNTGRVTFSQTDPPSNPSMPIDAIIELGELLKAEMEAGISDESA